MSSWAKHKFIFLIQFQKISIFTFVELNLLLNKILQTDKNWHMYLNWRYFIEELEHTQDWLGTVSLIRKDTFKTIKIFQLWDIWVICVWGISTAILRYVLVELSIQQHFCEWRFNKNFSSSSSSFFWLCNGKNLILFNVLLFQYEDIVQLEWLSNFVEDSFSGGSLTMKKMEPSCTTTKEDLTHTQFQISSPVSVLESSSSCSGEKVAPRSPEIYIPVPCGRARSKRQRPATFNPHPVMQLISPASSVGENTQPNVTSKASSDSENFAESHPVIKLPRQASGEHKKKKKTKASNPLAQDDTNQNAPVQAVRKCMHCEITKTPQWRAGPMGPKTLCNACGVRYKSGRLFPEYRPAASPTFCPAVHSNSHKKVLEMRNKIGKESGFTTDSAASPELIPNTNGRLGLEYMWGMEWS